MKSFVIENVPIHSPDSVDEMKEVFGSLIDDRKTKYISFINPEIFLQQQNDDVLHSYFQHSQYNFIDGIGLLKAINKKLGTNFNIYDRYPGTDFFSYLPSRQIKIFLYGSKPGNAEKAKAKIEAEYSNINIVGTLNGYTKLEDSKIVEMINGTNPDILIVCTGCPRQEAWINKNISSLNVPVIFGNGGSIDFWSGDVKRAPAVMINLGFEWLFRLFQNFTPQRILRQSKLVNFLLNYRRGNYNISYKM